MKVNRRSLRFRLFLMTVIVSVIAVGAVGLFSSHLTILKFQQYVESDAETVLESAREILAEDYSRNGSLDGAQAELERLAKIATKQFILLNTEGRIIATSGGSLSAAQIEVAPNHTVSLRWPEERARDNELGNAGTVRPFQFRLLDVPHVGLQSSSGVPLGTLFIFFP